MNRNNRTRLLMTSAAVALAIALSPATLAAQSPRTKGLKHRFTVVYSFQGGRTDGETPNALLMDTAGNLYGTTEQGGSGTNRFCYQGCGTVFKLDTSGQETVLYSFRGGADGQNPVAGVIMDSAGNLYGTTEFGGPYSEGIAFELDTNGNETVLHRFGDQLNGDGAAPTDALIRDDSGNLYGTTQGGGDGADPGDGTAFKLDSSGKETGLWSMTFPGGTTPYGGLTRGPGGLFYGTTSIGGYGNGENGVVFIINPANGQFSSLYEFKGYPDGSNSESGVIRDQAGNLYGTTRLGGKYCAPSGCGTVFKVTKTGKETLLYSFGRTSNDGNLPKTGVVRDNAGNLYGTTYSGGKAGFGTVYKLDTAGKETVLHSFTGGRDGGYPQAGVIIGKDGNLYGTAGLGGDRSCGSNGEGCGTVWKLTP